MEKGSVHSGDQTISFTHESGHLAVVGQSLMTVPESVLGEFAKNVLSLDLSSNELDSVPLLSCVPQIKNLVMDNNRIRHDADWPAMPQLETLWVNSNWIEDLKEFFDRLAPKVPRLSYLSMLKNPACPNFFTGRDQDDYERYRLYVLHRMPDLKFIDATPVTEAERKEAKRVGHLMLPSRATPIMLVPGPAEDDSGQPPLPADLAEPGAGAAIYARSKYTYQGRQSEGNRFILNSDL